MPTTSPKTVAIAIGSTVRPANDGEDSRGVIKWTKLTGTVIDIWIDCGEHRAEVRWHRKSSYPSVVPANLLTIA